MQEGVSVVLGRQRAPSLEIPGELLQCYQQVLGSTATMVWVNLRWMALTGVQGAIEEMLGQMMAITPPETMEALRQLTEYELLELEGKGKYLVHEPLPAEVFAARFGHEAEKGKEKAAPKEEAPKEKKTVVPQGAAPPVGQEYQKEELMDEVEVKPRRQEHRNQLQADIDALMRMYEKRIGLYSGSHVEKLRSWVEDQHMSTEVVLRAIDEAAQAKVPRLNYIEGILRNWHNSGIRTLPELDEWQNEKGNKKASMEGTPNAEAYKRVDQSLVQRWKELYPDEYDS